MEITKIKKNAKDYGIPIIRTESHKYLEALVKRTQPKRILEIGTAVGYSGITMLKASPEATLLTIEHNPESVKIANKNFAKQGLKNRATVLFGDCLVELAKMVASKEFDGYFDFIFLDGPKAQYDMMLNSLVMLLAKNGTFVADNVLFRGYVNGETTAPTRRYKTIIKRLNEFIENCKNHQFLTDFKLENIEDGIVFAKKVSNEKQ